MPRSRTSRPSPGSGTTMPNYSFTVIDTREQFDVDMSMSDLDQFLLDHPELSQDVCCPAIISGVPKKPDDGFRDILRNAKKKHSQGMTKSTINTF